MICLPLQQNNKMDYQLFDELNKFNGIKYIDSTHQYHYDGIPQTSVTTFIGKFKPKFDSEKEAQKYATKRGLVYEEVLESWDYTRNYASLKGRTFHSYAENWYYNRIFEYDGDGLKNQFGESIVINVEKMIKLFKQFYADSKNVLVPIRSELIVGDKDYNISGTVDQLFYNKKYNELQIFDWKTNKAIDFSNAYGNRFNKPISHLEVCEFNTYSLQLSTYKHLIEKNTNLKIGNTYIVWFNELNEEYKIFKCANFEDEFQKMLKFVENDK